MKKNKIIIIFTLIILIVESLFIIYLFNNISTNIKNDITNKYEVELNDKIWIYEIESQINIYVIISIIILCLSTGTVVYINIFLNNQEEHKIKKILKNIKDIKNKDYKPIFNNFEQDDLGILKAELYKTVITLQEYAQNNLQDKNTQAKYLADISHQLRTNLLSISILLDVVLEDELEFPESKRKTVYDIATQVEKMKWLIESLLKMAQLDTKVVVLKREEIKVKDFFRTLYKKMEILLELREQRLKFYGDDNQTFWCDKEWSVEAFSNIIKNASEHSKTGTTISIYCRDNPLYMEFEIIDEGSGIPEEELPHIFERFYKGKSSDINSFGIGLSLAREIIVAQNGEIKVESELNKGSKFSICFLNRL